MYYCEACRQTQAWAIGDRFPVEQLCIVCQQRIHCHDGRPRPVCFRAGQGRIWHNAAQVVRGSMIATCGYEVRATPVSRTIRREVAAVPANRGRRCQRCTWASPDDTEDPALVTIEATWEGVYSFHSGRSGTSSVGLKLRWTKYRVPLTKVSRIDSIRSPHPCGPRQSSPFWGSSFLTLPVAPRPPVSPTSEDGRGMLSDVRLQILPSHPTYQEDYAAESNPGTRQHHQHAHALE